MQKYCKHILVFVIGCATLLTFLGYTEYYTKGEPREAIVAVTMLDSGNWILPTNNGGDMAYKPPFFHWCIAATSMMTGRVTEFTSRIPSALALIALAVATFAFYHRRRGETLAMLAALLTLTNFEVHRAGVNCRVDMVLTACIVGAMYLLYRWCERGCKGVPVVAILLMSMATLTKGPVGIVLPCLVTGVYMLLQGKGFWHTFFRMSFVGLASVILPAVWYFAAYKQGGQQFLDLVMEENFGRFTGTMSYDSHVNPWYYNVLTVLSGFLPYTLLAIAGLPMVKIKSVSFKGIYIRLKNWISQMDDVRMFSFLAIVLIFVFYCIPKSKRSVYLLPIYPFLAYFMGEFIKYCADNREKYIKVFLQFIGRTYELIFVVFLTIRLSSFSVGSASMQLYVDALRNAHVNILQIATICLPVLLFELRNLLQQRYAIMKYYLAPVLVMAVMLAMDSTYQPIALHVQADRKTTDKVLSIVPNGPIYSFVDIEMMRFFVINFYSGNRVLLFDKEMPKQGYVLLREKDAPQFMARHQDYKFKQVFKSKQKGCDVRDYVLLCKFTRCSPLQSPQ